MPIKAAREVRVGLVQTSCSDDVAENLKKALAGISEAAARGAQIVCLQELFRSRYFCQSEESANFDLAEPIPGPSTEILGAAARRHGISIISSLFERRAPGLYHNTAAVLGKEGTVQGIYRKMHIPDDPLYYEKYYFTPGDLGFKTFQVPEARIGTLICWDQWYPEAARLTALRGAEILFYPTAIGWHPGEKAEHGDAQQDAWETIQRSHAIANGNFVVVVNRVGLEGGLEFWGGSFVADPFGRVLAKASHSKEEVLVVACDLNRVEETRRGWPFLRDRRVDFYGDLVARFLEPGP